MPANKTYRSRYERPKVCTMMCPSCKRMCVLGAEHSNEMHRCGFHEWVYGMKGRVTFILFYNGLEGENNDKN